MLLPNGKRAIVDIRKLRDYCLNPDNPRGSGKARVFARALESRRKMPRGCVQSCSKQLSRKMQALASLIFMVSVIRLTLRWRPKQEGLRYVAAGSFYETKVHRV